MSGGVAYVYDKDDRLERLVNEDVAGDLFRIESTEVRRPWILPLDLRAPTSLASLPALTGG